MATHELYIGGPSTKNYSQAMFPAVPFVDTAAPFTLIGPAAHKGPIGYNDTRLLDFGADHALTEFSRNTTIAQGDVLGVVLIPKNMLFLGFYYKIVTPQAGLTLTPALRGNATAFTAISGAAVAEGFVAPGGGALVTEGIVSMASVYFDIKPNMLDLTLTALPAGKLGSFKMIISPVLLSTAAGGYR